MKIVMINKFGKKLRHMRMLRGITQKELAARVGLSGFTISSWENGASTPSSENIQRIAKALSVE